MKEKKPHGWTHTGLCEFMAKFAEKKMNAGIVFVEHKTQLTTQIPDVLIFRPTCSIEFEIKVSRSDFLSDKKKPHRMNPELGVGDYRFYVAPQGLINVSDLSEHWGLIEVSNNGKRPRVHLTKVPPEFHCLYGQIIRVQDNLRKLYKEYFGQEPYEGRRKNILRDIKRTEQQLSFIFPVKNVEAEQHFLYAAHRQEIIAAQSNLPTPPKTIIWHRPFMNGMMDEGRVKTSN